MVSKGLRLAKCNRCVHVNSLTDFSCESSDPAMICIYICFVFESKYWTEIQFW